MSLAPDTQEFAEAIALATVQRFLDLQKSGTVVVPEFLNSAQAAIFTGFTEKALEHYRKAGVGPAYSRIGNRCRYNVHDLRAWMEAHRVVPQSKGAQ